MLKYFFKWLFSRKRILLITSNSSLSKRAIYVDGLYITNYLNDTIILLESGKVIGPCYVYGWYALQGWDNNEFKNMLVFDNGKCPTKIGFWHSR